MWNGAEGIIVVSCGFLVSVNGYARNLQKDYYYALSPVPHVNTPRKNLRFLLKKRYLMLRYAFGCMSIGGIATGTNVAVPKILFCVDDCEHVTYALKAVDVTFFH